MVCNTTFWVIEIFCILQLCITCGKVLELPQSRCVLNTEYWKASSISINENHNHVILLLLDVSCFWMLQLVRVLSHCGIVSSVIVAIAISSSFLGHWSIIVDCEFVTVSWIVILLYLLVLNFAVQCCVCLFVHCALSLYRAVGMSAQLQ